MKKRLIRSPTSLALQTTQPTPSTRYNIAATRFKSDNLAGCERQLAVELRTEQERFSIGQDRTEVRFLEYW
jgi:hypothetical protein